jgi:branched-chain amino acid transport system substrate-binding protein
MKKALCILMILSMALGLATGCGASKQEVINVGYLVHITGDSALWGMAEKNGAQLAVDEINKAGGILGKQLNLQFYDGRGNSADSVNAVKKGIEQDKMSVMLGSNLSGPTIAAGPICAQNKVPQVASFATNLKVTSDDSGNTLPWSFRLCFTDPYQGKIISHYAIEKLNLKKACILYDVTSDYSSGICEYIEKGYSELNGTILAKLAFRGGDVDFRPQLSEIKAQNPEVLILPNLYKENALIAKQAYDLGLNVPIIAGDSFSPSMFEICPNLKQYYTVQHFSWDDPALKEIKEKYTAAFKEDKPELNAAMGYDMVYFIADCIKRANSTDGEAIRKAIETADKVKLTHATITIDPATHNPLNKEGVILLLENGKDNFVERFAPAN